MDFQLGQLSRSLIGFGAAVLVIGGINDVSARSSGSDSWWDETSFMAINVRSRGSMKIGLGLGLLGLSLCGVELNDDSPETIPVLRKGESRDNTPESDFETCVKLYKDSGGRNEPNFKNSYKTSMKITLLSDYGMPLAKFVSPSGYSKVWELREILE